VLGLYFILLGIDLCGVNDSMKAIEYRDGNLNILKNLVYMLIQLNHGLPRSYDQITNIDNIL
jgi:hypothetical protein